MTVGYQSQEKQGQSGNSAFRSAKPVIRAEGSAGAGAGHAVKLSVLGSRLSSGCPSEQEETRAVRKPRLSFRQADDVCRGVRGCRGRTFHDMDVVEEPPGMGSRRVLPRHPRAAPTQANEAPPRPTFRSGMLEAPGRSPASARGASVTGDRLLGSGGYPVRHAAAAHPCAALRLSPATLTPRPVVALASMEERLMLGVFSRSLVLVDSSPQVRKSASLESGVGGSRNLAIEESKDRGIEGSISPQRGGSERPLTPDASLEPGRGRRLADGVRTHSSAGS